MVKNDFVQTPQYVTEALLERESFEGGILEPCCGAGAISKVLLASGYSVTSLDKNDYGYGSQRDLFTINEPFDNVVTNPPFTQVAPVCRHLLNVYQKKMALFFYVKNIGTFLESNTSKELKTVYILNQKIDWVETKLGWKFAWYIWEKGYEGDVTIHRIERGLTSLAADGATRAEN